MSIRRTCWLVTGTAMAAFCLGCGGATSEPDAGPPPGAEPAASTPQPGGQAVPEPPQSPPAGTGASSSQSAGGPSVPTPGSGEPSGSQPGAPRVEKPPRADVMVFAAVSTTEAINEITRRFSEKHGVTVRVNAAGSSRLAQQVAFGADADVFLAANADWVDFLQGRGMVAKRRNLLGNRLVIIVPNDSELEISKPEDLTNLRVRHLAVADPQAVPAGIYARQALERLGLWTRLRAKAAAADDVRAALTYVATGSAQAGIVYATDAAASKAVRVVYAVPEDLSDPIVYPAALLKGARENRMAQAFYDYLASPEAAEVFEGAGFRVLASGRSPSPVGPPEQ